MAQRQGTRRPLTGLAKNRTGRRVAIIFGEQFLVWDCQLAAALEAVWPVSMSIPGEMPRLKGYRFPREIITHAVWAYHRFALGTAYVEDLLAERGVIVSRETVRKWVNRFGRDLSLNFHPAATGVPLSETIIPGLPRRSITVANSRATRRPGIEVSGIAARHSRVTSSTTLSTLKRWPLASWS